MKRLKALVLASVVCVALLLPVILTSYAQSETGNASVNLKVNLEQGGFEDYGTIKALPTLGDLNGPLNLNVSGAFDEDTFFVLIKSTADVQTRAFWQASYNRTVFYLASMRFVTSENIRTEYGKILRSADGGYYGSGGKYVEHLPTAGWHLWDEREEIRLSPGDWFQAYFTLHMLMDADLQAMDITLTVGVW